MREPHDETISPVPTLLAKMNEERARRREEARRVAYERLRAALADLLPPGSEIWVFGSIMTPGRFREDSDVDIAVEHLPSGRTEAWLQYELALRLDRGVDVLSLGDTSLRDRILREGKKWIL